MYTRFEPDSTESMPSNDTMYTIPCIDVWNDVFHENNSLFFYKDMCSNVISGGLSQDFTE